MIRRSALVCGATGDIGQAVAAALAETGVDVIAVGRRGALLGALAARHPGAIEPVAADLTLPAGRDDVVAAASRRGRLDLLVLGSGIYERSHDPAALARQLAANVEAPYALLRAVLPLLVAAMGHVVVVNSTQGLAASAEAGQYAATQHAMRAIADSLRDEVNALGVRVASIFLGRTATSRQAAIFAAERRDYLPERLLQPEDVAGLVTMLLHLPPTAEVTNLMVRPRVKT